MSASVYMLLCEDGSFYTGWSDDPLRRFAAHKAGRGARYTRSHRPVELAYVEECGDKPQALRREIALKKLTHRQKQALSEAWKRGKQL